MSKKHKPKWEWEPAGTFPPNPFRENDFQKIADALKVPALSKDLRSQLVKAVQKYFTKKPLDEKPRRAEVNAGLEDIHDKAKAFVDCLKQLDGATREKMMIAYTAPAKEMAEIVEKKSKKTNKELKKLIEKGIIVPSDSLTSTKFLAIINQAKSNANKVSMAAKRAMSDIKSLPLDKGGRRSDLSLNSLIEDLIEIYEHATGKKAGMPYKNVRTNICSGPLYNFVTTYLDIIKHPTHSAESLAQKIRRILISRKKVF